MADPIFARQRQIIGTTAEWHTDDLILGAGELALVRQGNGSVRARVGDGITPFSATPYLDIGTSGIIYRGEADPTAPPPAGSVPGDAWSANPAGVVAPGWGAPVAGQAIALGDLLVLDAEGIWHIQPGAIDLAGVVTEAELGAPTGAGMVGFIQSGALARARPIEVKARERLSISDFTGADPSGAADSTGAILAAIAEAAASRRALYVDGAYRYTSQILNSASVQFYGNGQIVSDKTFRSNSCFVKDYDSGPEFGFVFDAPDCATEGVQYDSVPGKSGGLVQVKGTRWNAPSIALTNGGDTNLWIGAADAVHSINANAWRVGLCRTFGSGGYGFLVEDISTPAPADAADWPLGIPDANAGFLEFLDTRENLHGWKIGNSIDNVVLSIVTQGNAGKGGVFGSRSRSNYIFKHYSEANGDLDYMEVDVFQSQVIHPSRARELANGWVNNSGNKSNFIGGRNASVGSVLGVDTVPEYWPEEFNLFAAGSAVLRLWGTPNIVPLELRLEADGASGTKLVVATRETGNVVSDKLEITEAGWLNILKATRGLKVGGVQVIGAQQAAIANLGAAPTAADFNGLLATLRAHGIIAP